MPTSRNCVKSHAGLIANVNHGGSNSVLRFISDLLPSATVDVYTPLIAFGLGMTAGAGNKVIGPTADRLGILLRDFILGENGAYIYKVFRDKLGKKIERAETVNTRVAKAVLEDGPFISDVFSAEYFGGLLAAARTPDGEDDSTLPFLVVVKALSSRQLRLHFIIYSLIARHCFNNDAVAAKEFLDGVDLRVNQDELLESMGLGEGHSANANLLLALMGLVDHQLISGKYSYHTLSKERILIHPTAKGASLFLRALGLQGCDVSVLTSLVVESSLSEGIKEAMTLPRHELFRYTPQRDPLTDLRAQIEYLTDQVEELESKADEDE